MDEDLKRFLAFILVVLALGFLAWGLDSWQDSMDQAAHQGCTKVEIHDAPGYGGNPWFWQCPKEGK